MIAFVYLLHESPMIKSIACLTLALAIALSPSSRAQELFSDLSDLYIFSIIYSRTQNQAIVGLIDKRGIGSYSVCDLPMADRHVKISLKLTSGCRRLADTNFVANPETIEALNLYFPEILRNVLSELQAERNLSDHPQEQNKSHSQMINSVLLSLFFGSLGTGLSISAMESLKWSGFRPKAFGLFKGAMGTGLIGAALWLAFTSAQVMFAEPPAETRLVAIEDFWIQVIVSKIQSGKLDSSTGIGHMSLPEISNQAEDFGSQIFESLKRALPLTVRRATST